MAGEKYFSTAIGLIESLVKSKNIHALILQSPPGLGKSYITVQTLQKLGMKPEKDFIVISGYVTPLQLYQTLHQYQSQIIVVDDISSVFENPTSKSILLACLWNPTNKRTVSYLSATEKLTVPQSFEFKGKVIFLVNTLPKELESLKSRCYHYRFDFSYDERIQIIKEIAKERSIPYEIIQFIERNTCEASDVDFRLLSKLHDLYLNNNGNWRKLGYDILETNQLLAYLKNLISSDKSVDAQVREWCEVTNRSRATYFRLKQKLQSKSLNKSGVWYEKR